MDTDTTKDMSNAAANTIQQVGDAVGDPANQMSGKTRELSGKAQQLYADTTALVRERTAESPLAVLGIVAAIGFLAGVAWANSGQAPSRTYPRNSGANDRAY
jgi:uncharacterized protein YjbJ (UPF0337 family)